MSSEKTLNVTFFDYNHNMMTLMFGIEEYNRTKHLQATILHHRYWHDHQGQPRRNPTHETPTAKRQSVSKIDKDQSNNTLI